MPAHLPIIEARRWAMLPDALRHLAAAAHGHERRRADEDDDTDRDEQTVQVVDGVAWVPIHGVVVPRQSLFGWLFGDECALDVLADRLVQVDGDPNVTAVVLHVDSPGGQVDGLPDMATRIRDMQTPTVALVDGLAASAAYWLASQAGQVASTSTGQAGSIGVFRARADVSSDEPPMIHLVAAGEHKLEGHPHHPFSDDERAAIQDDVDEVHGMFVADVAAGRRVSEQTVRADYGRGRLLSATRALDAGLIDEITDAQTVQARLAADGADAPPASPDASPSGGDDDAQASAALAAHVLL